MEIMIFIIINMNNYIIKKNKNVNNYQVIKKLNDN